MGSITRRRFLKSSAATFAALSASSLYSQPIASEKPLRFGIIGTGARARAHINAIKSFDAMQILGVCDVREAILADAAKRAGGSIQRYSEYQKLLDNKDINAVLIATPNLVHKEVFLAALQAGKHVMCEKPMATTFDDCKAMKQAAERATSQVSLFTMQLRYSPLYQQIRKLLESGKIGAPKQIIFIESRGDWNKDVWMYTDPRSGKTLNWRFSHTASGGTLNEKVCHYFDLMNWFAAAIPQSISCDGGIAVYKDGRDTWDYSSTSMTYPNDVQATHTLCMFGPHRLDLQIIGDEGALHLNQDPQYKLDGTILFQPRKGQVGGGAEQIPAEAEVRHGERGPSREMETALLRMYEDFAGCVEHKSKPFMQIDNAIASCKIAWLAELSAQRKASVNWEDIA